MRRDGDRRDLPTWAHVVLLGLACLAFVALGARWMHEFRSPPLLDIDEAGYQVFALDDLAGWRAGGWDQWWDAVLAPSIQAPLLTASTVPFLTTFGVGGLVGLLAPLTYAGLTLAATWWLAREHGTAGTAWLAWSLCAAAPVLVVYSRHYSFGTAAAATTTLALAALARSRGLRSTPWALVTGVLLGLTALSRTMMLALLPGLALGMVVTVLAGQDRRRRVVNLALTAVVGAAVAAPWYVRNGAAVLDYLTSFGYGSRSAEYGSDQSVLDPGSWQVMAQYAVDELGVVLSVLLAAGSALLVWRFLRPARATDRRPGRRVLESPLLVPAVFLTWSVLVMVSSGNKGTGFLAPLVPAACVLAALGIRRAVAGVRVPLVVVAVATLVVTTLAFADARSPLADRRTVDLPVLGSSLLLDGGGRTDVIVRASRPAVEDETPAMPPAEQDAWVRATREMARRLDAAGGTSTLTAFGFRHDLVHANATQLAQLTAGRPHLWLDQISPPSAEDPSTVRTWLDGIGACLLVTAPGTAFEIEPAIDQEVVAAGARAAGFRRESSWRLPDGRPVLLWRRPGCAVS